MREANPSAWLRQIYDLYKRSESNPALQEQASYRIIVKRASKSLTALFKKNDDCEAKGQGVCAIDWDFIMDGQDSALTNVRVGDAVVTGDKATVTVTFKNFNTTCINFYFFVREDGEWKVDDIKTKSGTDAPVWIAKQLRDYR